MSKILISIKPKYVEEILSGKKKYEYRKVQCNKKINTMIIYATAPIKKVVAEVEILNVLMGSPNELWNKTKEYSGITKEFFDEYFKNKPYAYAFQLGTIKNFENPKTLKDYGIEYAPQSFVYID